MPSLMTRVSDYYQQQRISPAGLAKFGCRHKPECRRVARENGGGEPFVCGRAAGISSGYERRVPRVLILSADWGRDRGSSPRERELGAMRQRMESEAHDPERSRRTSQWREECEIAKHVLGCSLREAPTFMARTNSLKCCANMPNSRQAPQRMFDNCREYLRAEIELLSPDILVTQGERAQAVVENEFGRTIEFLRRWISNDRSGGIGKWSVAHISLGQRRLLWVRAPFPRSMSYHPTASELDRCYARCARKVANSRKDL